MKKDAGKPPWMLLDKARAPQARRLAAARDAVIQAAKAWSDADYSGLLVTKNKATALHNAVSALIRVEREMQ